ncbi:MAG: hypothetical protein PHS37_01595 [Candidatus Omnitrophica bacterium]|nr:hypothetical protein [Candidatus Omnitrophota bacterium]
MRSAIIVAVWVVSVGSYAIFADAVWRKIPGIPHNGRITAVACLQGRQAFYFLGVDGYLFRKGDADGAWKKVFTCDGEYKGINDIYIYRNTIVYVATKNGIYRSYDAGDTWEKIFKWKLQKTRDVKACAIDGTGTMYILTNTVLYRVPKDTDAWEKIYTVGVPEEKSTDENVTAESEETALLNHVTADTKGVLYLSTNTGIFSLGPGALRWEKFAGTGLGNSGVRFCLVGDTGMMYAATGFGVYVYDSVRQAWSPLYKGLENLACNSLALDPRDKSILWCAADQALYTTAPVVDDTGRSGIDLSLEPSVKDVQAMAVRYAEVSPEKIKKWRKDAQIKALLPKVSFGLDHQSDNTYEIYTGATSHYTVDGPMDYSDGWDVTLSWELGDLIYSDAQTSIDSRSKLMVELRNDIMADVTRLYFERRRLQIELAQLPPEEKLISADKDLRIQELTATLDAYTGGEFSEAVETVHE